MVINSQNCDELSKNGDCQYYTQCLEPKYKCGPTGYPIGYGFKYCSKFVEHFGEFPAKGQEWITKTLVCLKTALTVDFTNCQAVNDAAFNSHPQCYYEAGFCDLFIDHENIKQTIKALLNVYDIKDFASAVAFKQIYQTGKLCGVSYLLKIAKILKELFGFGFLEMGMELPLDLN
jgi:hypothetical protein